MECFTATGEDGFDSTDEGVFAVERKARLWEGLDADDGGVDLGLWVKAASGDVEDFEDVAKHTKADGENGVIFAAVRFGGETFGDFFLEHEQGMGPKMPLFEEMEEDRRRDVVGQVAEDAEGSAFGEFAERKACSIRRDHLNVLICGDKFLFEQCDEIAVPFERKDRGLGGGFCESVG